MDLMEKIVNLSKRRGFIFPGSEIYGGLANSWDYGPLGVELKNNIKNEWWKRFVHSRTDVVGLDAALIMNPKVWEASGHLKSFTDPLVECKKCHERFRADKVEQNCSSCGGEFTKPKLFNLMFKTFLGPTSAEATAGKSAEEAANVVYLRPETAQAMFVDFKLITETMRRRLPFGIAQIGKAFRNEITPGNFIFRTREFEQMEIEYFVKEKEWEKYFDHWFDEIKGWLEHLGISKKKIHYREVPKSERAHYSKRTMDIDYEFPFGNSELYGLAYRGDFDLKNHQEKSGQDLTYTDPENPKNKFLPHVIEPTWGVDRSVLAAMLEAYDEEQVSSVKRQEDSEGEEETRVVMRFPFWLAPIKVAVLPLSKKEELAKIARPIHEDLTKKFICEYDETQSIGRRYRRQDEIGTPFCVTIDFETEKDKSVTVRDRDSMKQIRVETAKLSEVIERALAGEKFEKLGQAVK